jgi:hypothetical protein
MDDFRAYCRPHLPRNLHAYIPAFFEVCNTQLLSVNDLRIYNDVKARLLIRLFRVVLKLISEWKVGFKSSLLKDREDAALLVGLGKST